MSDDEQQVEERTDETEASSDGEEPSAEERAKQVAEEEEKAKEEMREMEQQDAEELPQDLEDWPSGKAKYETFGGPEGQHSYDEGPETKLGPSSLRHHEGGDTVTVEGEEVDDAQKFKGDPVPGGPTDQNSPDASGESSGDDERSGDDEASGDDERSDGPQASGDDDG